MRIARTTVQRIYEGARRKIALRQGSEDRGRRIPAVRGPGGYLPLRRMPAAPLRQEMLTRPSPGITINMKMERKRHARRMHPRLFLLRQRAAPTGRKDPLISAQKANELSHVKKVIAVVSGKGGVGKSLVTALLAVLTRRAGYKTAILDPRTSPARPFRRPLA